MNDQDRAIADCTAVIQFDNQNAQAFRDRGGYYRKNGELDKALADADTAIRLEAKNADSYSVRGSIYEKKGDFARAKHDYDRCRQLRFAALQRELHLPPASKQPKAAAAALEKRIKQEVRSLEYGDDVAQGVVTLVRDWDLVALVQQLDVARQRHEHGKLPADQLASVEQKVAEQTARIVNAVVLYDNEKESTHELTGVVADRKACCQGIAMLYFVLGRALGLRVEGLIVDVLADGPPPDGEGHAACLVTLSDGDVIIVDPTCAGLGHRSLVSKAFRFDLAFCPLGNCSELIDKSNPLGLYQVVQREGTSGLVAMLYASRAVDQKKKGNATEAARWCSEAIARNPNCARSYGFRGDLLADAGQFDKAIWEYSTAISRDPALAVAIASRGDCYAKWGKLDQAQDDYRAALKVNPKFSCASEGLGAIYLQQGDFEKAVIEFNKVIDADRKASSIYALCALARLKKAMAYERFGCSRAIGIEEARQRIKKYDEEIATGVADCSEAIRLNPKLIDAYHYRGWLYAVTRRFDLAIADYCEAIRIDGKNAALRHERGMLYEGLGQRDKAVADLNEAIRLDPKYVDAYQSRAHIYAATNRFELAFADYTESIRIDGKNAELRRNRSEVYQRLGQLDKAIADLDEAIRLDPKTAENYTARAALYAKKHDTNKVAADLAEAQRLKPSDNRYR